MNVKPNDISILYEMAQVCLQFIEAALRAPAEHAPNLTAADKRDIGRAGAALKKLKAGSLRLADAAVDAKLLARPRANEILSQLDRIANDYEALEKQAQSGHAEKPQFDALIAALDALHAATQPAVTKGASSGILRDGGGK